MKNKKNTPHLTFFFFFLQHSFRAQKIILNLNVVGLIAIFKKKWYSGQKILLKIKIG